MADADSNLRDWLYQIAADIDACKDPGGNGSAEERGVLWLVTDKLRHLNRELCEAAEGLHGEAAALLLEQDSVLA